MLACIDRGLMTSGQLPGGLKVKRRAAAIFTQLEAARGSNARTAHEIMDYISVFAMAVNEENAAGGGSLPRRPMELRASSRQCCAIIATRREPRGHGRLFLLTATAVARSSR